jgi:hypothetical protein
MPELGTTLTSGWQAVWTSLPLFIAAFQVRRQRAVSG